MTKLLAIVTAVFALGAMFASAAEAGFKVRLGFGGPVPFHNHHFSNDYQPKTYRKQVRRKYQRRSVEKTYAAKKAVKAEAVAVAEPAPKAEVEWENSSIATAEKTVAKAGTEEAAQKGVQTASADAPKELGCKKFFASVGMVLSVPCE